MQAKPDEMEEEEEEEEEEGQEIDIDEMEEGRKLRDEYGTGVPRSNETAPP